MATGQQTRLLPFASKNKVHLGNTSISSVRQVLQSGEKNFNEQMIESYAKKEQFMVSLRKIKKNELLQKKRMINLTQNLPNQNQQLNQQTQGQGGVMPQQNIFNQGNHINAENIHPNISIPAIIARDYKIQADNPKSFFIQSLMEFNINLKARMSFDELSISLQRIKENLPNSHHEILEAFSFMIDEGIMKTFSQLIFKLQGFVFHPLLSNILWLIEDFSGAEKEQEQELLDSNIIARLSSLIETIGEILMIDSKVKEHEQKIISNAQIVYLCKLTCQILTILSNLASSNPGARQEILKHRLISKLSVAFSNKLFIGNEEFLDIASWFLLEVSNKFDKNYEDQVEDEYLIPFLARLLHLPDNRANKQIINNSLEAIINFTKVKKSYRCSKLLIQYDRKCGLHQEYQLFSWVYNITHRILESERNLDNYERMKQILTMLNNMLTSDDHDIQYLIEMGLSSYIEKVLEWNDPKLSVYCEEFDLQICNILQNLCASSSFGHGQDLIDKGIQYILDRFSLKLQDASEEMRLQSLLLFSTMLFYLKDHYKEFLLQTYDIIPKILQNLVKEKSLKMINIQVHILETCIVRDLINHDYESESIDPQNVCFGYLEQFEAYGGIEILLNIREMYKYNHEINNKISAFEQKFFNLQSSSLEDNQFGQSNQGSQENNHMDPQIYLKTTQFQI
eukprot:403368940